MSGGMGLSYSLSPRTQVGLNVEENRMTNQYQNANTTNATVSAGRKMGMRWFLSLRGGGSVIQTTQSIYNVPTSTPDHWRGLASVSELTRKHLRRRMTGRAPTTYGFAVGNEYHRDRELELAAARQPMDHFCERATAADERYGICELYRDGRLREEYPRA